MLDKFKLDILYNASISNSSTNLLNSYTSNTTSLIHKKSKSGFDFAQRWFYAQYDNNGTTFTRRWHVTFLLYYSNHTYTDNNWKQVIKIHFMHILRIGNDVGAQYGGRFPPQATSPHQQQTNIQSSHSPMGHSLVSEATTPPSSELISNPPIPIPPENLGVSFGTNNHSIQVFFCCLCVCLFLSFSNDIFV